MISLNLIIQVICCMPGHRGSLCVFCRWPFGAEQAVAFSQALAAVLGDLGVAFQNVVLVNATDTGSTKGTLQRRRLLQVYQLRVILQCLLLNLLRFTCDVTMLASSQPKDELCYVS